MLTNRITEGEKVIF